MGKPCYQEVISPQVSDDATGLSKPIEQVEYLLDPHDHIVDVSGSWMDFARDNEGAMLGLSQIMNQPIWQYVIGEETRDIYQQLLKHVRDTGQVLDFAYRCDSPNCRRYMRMRLEAEADDFVRFINQVMKVSPIEKSQTSTKLSYTGMINRCSLCSQVELDGEWIEMAYAVEQGLLDRDIKPIYMYKVCPACKQRLRNMLEEQVAKCESIRSHHTLRPLST